MPILAGSTSSLPHHDGNRQPRLPTRGRHWTAALAFALVGCGGQVDGPAPGLSPEPVPATARYEAPVESAPRAETGANVGLVGGSRLYAEARDLFPALKRTELTSITFASVQVRDDGSLALDDALLFAEGRYVGDPEWPALVADLERAPTHLRRLEVLLVPNDHASLAQVEPNLRALRQTLPNVDAISFDDRTLAAPEQVVELGRSIAALGMKLSIMPTPSQAAAWGKLKRELDAIDASLFQRIMLDLDANGTERDVASWSTWFSGVALEPGWSGRHGRACETGNAPEIVTKKAFFLRDAVQGAWVRWHDDSTACDAQYAPVAYARAIHDAWTFQR